MYWKKPIGRRSKADPLARPRQLAVDRIRRSAGKDEDGRPASVDIVHGYGEGTSVRLLPKGAGERAHLQLEPEFHSRRCHSGQIRKVTTVRQG